jgi:hypothetical protein
MSIKKPLEQPIFNAIIHQAYMLHDDEREVLLRAFLEMSCKIHREAVEITSPEEDIGSLLAAHIQFEEASVTNSSSVAAAASAPKESAEQHGDHESAIAKHLQSFCHMFRRRESILQEEEELSLFSTIEGVADQVNREALELEIMGELKGDLNARFAAVYERDGTGPWGSMVVSEGEWETVVVAEGSKRVRQPGWPFDTYIECMDEELLITRGIIERNRVLSQGYLKAHAI